jgi:6-phosphogluconolactonase
MDFSPDGKYAYVLSELSGQIHVFRVGDGDGALVPHQTVKSEGETASDIQVAPGGAFAWAIFRGDNQIATYAIDAQSKLALAGKTSTGGMTSRSFAVDRQGRFALVSHAGGGGVTRFSIDAASGRLTELRGAVGAGELWFVGFLYLP